LALELIIPTGSDQTSVRLSLRLEPSTSSGAADGRGDRLGASGFRAILQVHDRGEPALMIDGANLWAGNDQRFSHQARVELMIRARRAARAWPPLEALIGPRGPGSLDLTNHEVEQLLTVAAARLAAVGVALHWPKAQSNLLTATVVLNGGRTPPSDLGVFLGSQALLSFDWQIAMGGQRLTAEEVDELAEAHRPIVRLRDQWVVLDPALAAKARDRSVATVPAAEALSVALAGSTTIHGHPVEVGPDSWLGQLRQQIADICPEMLEAPSALNASLRAYQLRGLRWLAQMTSLGLGACLADDMGLGKTITVIALHLHRQGDPRTACPTLVVCPASVLGNWQQEIERFAPGEKVHRFHGTGRSSPEGDTGFVLTTYSTMRRDAARIATTRWGLLIADEAQNVKNPMSATARALRTIPAQARVALTGTPVENSFSELWAILDWTTPGLLGTLPAFRARWAAAIESGQDRERAAADLATVIRPFLLRRRKSDPGIAPELPPKTETDHPVPLTREQVGLYEAVVRETLAQIERSEGMARRGLILKLLTGLKQICNHPAQFLKEKLPKIPNRSGKLDRLDELVDTITAEDGAVLVFTQYVAMAKLIDQHLRARGLATQLLHGGTPVARREEMVARFQASEPGSTPIFLLSLKAAGTGLNLTRADHVIHYDRWWNPAVEDQATDRAYRIGQHKPVQVHRLITQGTVEERIAHMLRAKRAVADSVLATRSEAAQLSELSNTELADLVTLRMP
jgi:superfamily II DNA or RNA helicase